MTGARARATGCATRSLAALLAALALATGPAAAASAENVSAQSTSRAVMILFDIHLSVNQAIAAEHKAVLTYVRALPPDVRAGLITFGDRWRLVLRPTANRARLAAAVAAIRPAGVTSNGLYPALEVAEAAVGGVHAARGRLVVFSDADALTGGVPTASLATDVVVWRVDGDDRLPWLRTLARASHGRAVSPANAASLGAAFPPLAPPRPPARHHAGQLATSATVRPARAVGSHLAGSLIAALAALFAALFLIALLTVGSLRQHDLGRNLTDRIERYGPHRAPAPPEGDGKVATAVVGWMTRLLRSTNSEPHLARRLDLAAIGRRPAEWALLGVAGSAALAGLLTVLTRSLVIGVLAGGLIGWLGMRLVLSMRIRRRRAAFAEQLPDVLQLVAGSLQSGFSLEQAVDAVVRENTQPAAGEFSRALAEARLGADVEDALDGVASRMDSNDLRWAVMAVRIQRTVGGNLAEVLRNTVGAMRERAFLRRHVRALSAEGRLSAYFIVALPVVIGGWLFFSDPTYMHPLYTTTVGLFILSAAAVLVVLGALWMRVLIRVEV